MAIPHFSVNVVARGSGRSAVLSAAYRHCAKMQFEREARTIDYTRKRGLLHEEFVIPADSPEWLRSMIADRSVAGASESFWNRVEISEKRSDAQLAKDVTIALPIELSHEQNIALVQDFVSQHVTARGMVADWVYHDAPGNPHVHMMTTLRPLTESGFGSKKVAVLGPDGNPMRNGAGKIVYELWAGSPDDFNTFRDGWFDCQNRHLTLAGLDVRVDGQSFEKQGIELSPTIHLGVGTKAIERKLALDEQPATLQRLALLEERRRENGRKIRRRPELVLDMITREKSVFDERDVAKILHRYIDDPAAFQNLMVRILQSPDALLLEREHVDFPTGGRVAAKYTTRELIQLEAAMANRATSLSRQSSHGVRKAMLQKTFSRHLRLSDEQKTAVEHVAGGERIAAVVGRAGAGKTTMMKAARQAWEAAGYRVVGGALAGKAAEGLEKEAGIESRTLASWTLRWSGGRDKLDTKTVFVLDEAGMVSSRQMAIFVEAAEKAGAKLVLIGDPEQLQPIEAGAAFRAIVDRIGYAELETIYRQNEQWMRDASLCLARGNIAAAIDAYRANGRVSGSELKAEAVHNLIADWDRDYSPTKTTLILAHLRRDVRMLNEMARAKLVGRGVLREGFVFRTEDGNRHFAPGDHIVFLKNDASLGVKNGMFGKVLQASTNRIVAEIGEGEHSRQVVVEQRFYSNLDYGYATTIHKSQGATLDRVKVLASLSLDRHLTYVALTRHREDLRLYYGTRSFAKAGGLFSILSRKNSKETTLDYRNATFYRQALRFADARAMHLVNVARSMARDQLECMRRQKPKFAMLADRLATIGVKLGLTMGTKANGIQHPKEARPMVSGVSTFAKSVGQVVSDELDADPGLKAQWEDVSTRFRLVYAQPEAAFKRVNVDAMLTDETLAKSTLSKIIARPETYGPLKGRTGLLANRVDKLDRDRAERNAPALAQSLGNYLAQRRKTERHYQAEEEESRRRVSIDIPSLSLAARQVVERVRNAIDESDPQRAVEVAQADIVVKVELEKFAKAVSERFGDRTFLPLAAKDTDGETFRTITAEMSPGQKAEVYAAWNIMRTVQQLGAHQRTIESLQQSEAFRHTMSRGLSLK